MDQIFNNREIATAIWLLILFLFVIRQRKVRRSIKQIFNSLFHFKKLFPIILMIFYTAICVIALYFINFWSISMLKETIYWMLGTAFIGLINANEIKQQNGFFKQTILKYVTLVFVLGFILNIYTFPLWIELLLVPTMTFTALSIQITELQKSKGSSYELVNKMFNKILSLIGLILLIFTIYNTIYNYGEYFTIQNAKDLILPIILSTLYLPFIYLWALFLIYDELFIRININNKDHRIVYFMKKRILTTFHLRLWKLLEWEKQNKNLRVFNIDQAKNLIK